MQDASRPLTAAEVAVRLGTGGCRETQRRQVRAIVRQLRDNGCKVVATLQQGYWLTDDDGLWRDYLEGRQIDAKRILAETHKRKRMQTDAKGQGLLFTERVPVGCATMGVT